MANCPMIAGCVFNDQMKNMPATSTIYRNYCQRDYTYCARFLVRNTMGGEHVPRSAFLIKGKGGNHYPKQRPVKYGVGRGCPFSVNLIG